MGTKFGIPIDPYSDIIIVFYTPYAMLRDLLRSIFAQVTLLTAREERKDDAIPVRAIPVRLGRLGLCAARNPASCTMGGRWGWGLGLVAGVQVE